MNDGKQFNYAWIILIIAVMAVTGALGFARFGYTTILPAMKTGLNLNDAQAGDLASGNLAGYLILALISGILSSKFGPRKIISIFMTITAIAIFLTGISDNFITALIARILTGMGSGGVNVPVMGLISAWFAGNKRGFATGIAVSGSSIGMVITGTLIPIIINSNKIYGWKYAWIVLSFITIIFALLCFLFIRNSPNAHKNKTVGNNLICTNGKNNNAPVQWKLIYKNFSAWHLAFIYILFGFSNIIYATFYVRYLNNEAGFSLQMAGTAWAVIGALSIISGLIWGTISDKIPRKYAMAIVFFLQSASYLFFGLIKSPAGYFTSSLLFALTAWSIPAIMAATVGDTFGSVLAPAAFGFVTFFFGIGQVAGPFISGRIALFTGSYSIAFISAGLAAFAGAMVCISIRTKSMPPV